VEERKRPFLSDSLAKRAEMSKHLRATAFVPCLAARRPATISSLRETKEEA